MDIGDLLTGVCIGGVSGVFIGLIVPEDRKNDWIKAKQKSTSTRWDAGENKKNEWRSNRRKDD